MELTFSAEMIPFRGRGLTFDDVLLVPCYSEISSRRHPKLSSRITKKIKIDMPLISSNMDTITGDQMAIAMGAAGGVGIMHRFMSPDEQLLQVKKVQTHFKENNIHMPIAASIGVKEEGMRRADLLADSGASILTLDIAHGDSIMMIETLDYVKKKYPHLEVIAGNIATAEAARRLIDHGADAIKVGIGPGSMCTTRIITGHGVPQLTAIAMCVHEAKKHNVPVIADGGVKNSGDVVKALCAGAETVMLGSMLSGTLETPGEVKGGMKLYRGMASKSAQVSWRGELPKGMAAEGESTMIPCKGQVEHVLHEILGGLRSGMSYLGVEELTGMASAAVFMEMTAAGMHESRPHGVR